MDSFHVEKPPATTFPQDFITQHLQKGSNLSGNAALSPLPKNTDFCIYTDTHTHRVSSASRYHRGAFPSAGLFPGLQHPMPPPVPARLLHPPFLQHSNCFSLLIAPFKAGFSWWSSSEPSFRAVPAFAAQSHFFFAPFPPLGSHAACYDDDYYYQFIPFFFFHPQLARRGAGRGIQEESKQLD